MPPPVPEIWGIVNVTPDSFSDGGLHDSTAAALEHACALREAGACVLDIGGESTRPGADPVEPEAEAARVLPVIEGLASLPEGVRISVDTRRTAVAEQAIRQGARIVNDVGAARDPGMLELVAEAGVELVLMHMQGEPRTMQRAPSYRDVVSDVAAWLGERVAAAERAGVPRGRLYVDPGIGFGKTLEHNLALIRALPGIREQLGTRILLGASRKAFIGTLTGRSLPRQRVAGSLAVVAHAFRSGIDAIRVHDVAETHDVLAVLAALEG